MFGRKPKEKEKERAPRRSDHLSQVETKFCTEIHLGPEMVIAFLKFFYFLKLLFRFILF